MPIARENNEPEVWMSPPSLDCKRVEVSNLGRIRTLDSERIFLREGKIRKNKVAGRTINPHRDPRGRWMVQGGSIKKGMYGKGILLHRLVAECFVPNPKPKEYDLVFFNDGNPGNCRADNLSWGNRKEWGIKNRGKNTYYTISVYKDGMPIGIFFGIGEAARAIGTSKQSIFFSIRSGTFRCKGFDLNVEEHEKQSMNRTIGQAKDLAKEESKIVDIPDTLYA